MDIMVSGLNVVMFILFKTSQHTHTVVSIHCTEEMCHCIYPGKSENPFT